MKEGGRRMKEGGEKNERGGGGRRMKEGGRRMKEVGEKNERRGGGKRNGGKKKKKETQEGFEPSTDDNPDHSHPE